MGSSLPHPELTAVLLTLMALMFLLFGVPGGSGLQSLEEAGPSLIPNHGSALSFEVSSLESEGVVGSGSASLGSHSVLGTRCAPVGKGRERTLFLQGPKMIPE